MILSGTNRASHLLLRTRQQFENGDFVHAIEIDAPRHILQFLEHSNALAVGTLSTFERELIAGEIVPLPIRDQALYTRYGFIYLKERSLPPAVQAYMSEVRAVEEEFSHRERQLAELKMK